MNSLKFNKYSIWVLSDGTKLYTSFSEIRLTDSEVDVCDTHTQTTTAISSAYVFLLSRKEKADSVKKIQLGEEKHISISRMKSDF